MRLSFNLQTSQKQIQKLAPRMIQSMEILQLPLLDLQDRIDQEMTENPVLEIDDVDPLLPDAQSNQDVAEPEGDRELVVEEDSNNADDFERLDNLDGEMPDYFDERPRLSANRIQDIAKHHHDAMANVSTRSTTLYEHLMVQLGELDLQPEVYALSERIASSLDAENGGYLQVPVAELIPSGQMETMLPIADDALEVVQSLDPIGVCARDLKECLLLQLSSEHPDYRELHVLITNHLEDLQHNRLPLIEKQTGLSVQEIQLVWEELKQLNPKPASSFVERHVQVVSPDLYVVQQDNGSYLVKADEWDIPQLYISDYYRRRLSDPAANAEEKEFLRRKLNAAQWLIDAITQRRSTMLKVAQAIVDHQHQFLEDGPEAIIPLKMQQIADRVKVHVTTVSRAVDNKWLQTPRGIFALRGFFVGGTTKDDGENVAWDKIRVELQQLIDGEDKAHPYSDDELVKRLKAAGLTVARRTIAKYRKKMGILSSRQRKDWTQVNP
ncbi:MAG: RNA polymerase factor sigma-54 [Planctomycetota bacterium]|nr:RNA polymerase factor sigma-54 [Planctomycetota bacterium]